MKKKQLDSKLVKYSVAAGAVVAGASGAEAAIQTGIIDKTIGNGGDTFSLNIDFNNDLTSDFNFSFSSTTSSTTSGSSSKNAWATALNGAQLLMASSSVANLSKSAVISESVTSGLSWAASGGSLFWTYYGNNYVSAFSSGNTGYIGFRFDPNGGSSWLYGWVEIDSVAADFSSFHISDYAYQDDMKAGPITAGVVPEPSSLALLALGAVGLRLLRSRYAKS